MALSVNALIELGRDQRRRCMPARVPFFSMSTEHGAQDVHAWIARAIRAGPALHFGSFTNPRTKYSPSNTNEGPMSNETVGFDR
ncbi:hypothetical protein BH11GEM2_BH11GEM2_38490 [soil metagenome]